MSQTASATVTVIHEAQNARGPSEKPDANETRSATGRLIVALSEATEELRKGTEALELEATAIALALDAMSRIGATTRTCATALLDQLNDQEACDSGAPGEPQQDSVASRIARPLGLAASATLALNASLTSSGNTLVEASLRIIYAGERLLEASRLAMAQRRVQPPVEIEAGNAQNDRSNRAFL